MSIDPRTMKALLQAQLAPSLNIGVQNKTTGTSGNNDIFETILSAQMASGEEAATGVMDGKTPVWSKELWAQVAQYGLSDAGALTSVKAEPSAHAGDSSAYGELIQQAAARHGVSPALVHAVIAAESGFNPHAQSHAGAKGLMQLMDGTARGLGVSDSFDPAQNIEGGTKYLSLLLRKYGGNEAVALAAYNAGPGRLDRLGISTDEELAARLNELPEETQRYIGKVQGAII
ncbi:lytic transglycosylase domain-containing protein [Paenibacillus sp. PL2-23]|uniref:lytic transglycosylase domain-containing protein n=1 Tax=Paenibacillus sp. PL2-23 TaxID=2100729 RepID=UPI0030F90E52